MNRSNPLCLSKIAVLTLTLALLFLSSSLGGKPLSIEAIYTHPFFYGTSPREAIWSPNSDKVAFSWNEEGERFRNVWLYDLKKNRLWRLTDMARIKEDPKEDDERTRGEREEAEKLRGGVGSLRWSPDGKEITFIYLRDLFTVNVENREVVRILHTEAGETNPQYSPDRKYLSFIRGGDLWYLDSEKHRVEQLTTTGSDTVVNGAGYYLSWLDEMSCYCWSPDSKRIAFTRYDLSEIDPILIPDYVGKRVKTTEQKRSIAGGKLADSKIGVISLESRETLWLDMGEETEYYIRTLKWSPRGDRLLLDKVSKAQKDRWILVADCDSGKVEEIFHESDSAWVSSISGESFWAPEGKAIIYSSDRTGYNHLYRISVNDGEPEQLISGKWEVRDIEVSPDARWVYFFSTEIAIPERHLFRLDLKTGKKERLTFEEGWYSPPQRYRENLLSPDGEKVVLYYTDNVTPWDYHLVNLRKRAKASRITNSVLPEFSEYELSRPKFFTFTSDVDGETVHALVWKPEDFDPSKRYPLIVHIHGAGYAQAVCNSWSSSGLFHQVLAQEGFVVVTLDYRGSSGYGRKFRTDVYRHLGNLDLEDAVSVVGYLNGLGYIDTSRVGIWGWSYGGFLTNMAMFKRPDVFMVGCSVAAVNDWENYNLWYTTERFNFPEEDSIAYKRSSPIHFAEGLKGKLLLIHGMADSNVHFQDTVQLIFKLVKNNKDFDVMIYPREEHGFSRDESYVHVFTKILEYFQEHLK
jgi:dipeptidyl-peptidase-4